MEASQIALIAMAAAFAVYLLVQVRPLLSPRRRALLTEVRAARKRAGEASTPAARALALADAAEAAARARRWTSAAGLFLRSLRADPHAVSIVERMSRSLLTRPRLLASILERRMVALDEAPAERPAFLAMAKTLRTLYEGPLRRRFHGKLMARLIAHEEAAVRAAPKT